MLKIEEVPSVVSESIAAVKLLEHLINRESPYTITPVYSPISPLGVKYPEVEELLGCSSEEAQNLLNALYTDKILEKQIYGTFLSCPECGSSNLEYTSGCPQCESNKVSRGRILEHFLCGNVSLEDEYLKDGVYICPKCTREVRYLGTEYRSIGVKYSCNKCKYIFDTPIQLCICRSCSRIFRQEKAQENVAYTYTLTPDKKYRLLFDFGLKKELIDYLRSAGYEVTENAKVVGSSKSGEEHFFDILAHKNDGFIEFNVCIDILLNPGGRDVGLDEVFKYDTKAYDLGIHDKMLIVFPGLNDKAQKFARNQRIVVYALPELEDKLKILKANRDKLQRKPVKYKNAEELITCLKDAGYLIEENAVVHGRSGISHRMDIFARIDDGLLLHTVAIGRIEKENISLDDILLFEVKAFDIGVHDKVLLIKGKVSDEAKRFIEHQRIKLVHFE